MRELHEVLSRTYRSWREDRTLRLGAGLAYYTLFTVLPFGALFVVLAGSLFGGADIQVYVVELLEAMGVAETDAVAEAVTELVARQSMRSSLGLLGLGSLLFAASLVFLALQDAIQTIWHQPVRSGLRNSLRRRLVAFIMVLTTVLLIVVSFAVSAVTGAARALLPGESGLLNDLADLVTAGTSVLPLAIMLALLYRHLPPASVPWKVAAVAASVTALLLVAGTSVIGWLLRSYGGASVTGAFGTLLAVLSWIYYEAQIILAGAQLTKVLGSEALGEPWDR
ncbi:MAG: YihY/virulence factor BrkB family protein [Actinomycetia bacterium]|nr:YihY/virulence factor BrkB family protein [Actinomycetes bacterium]